MTTGRKPRRSPRRASSSSSRESSPHRLLFIVRGDRGNARVSNACSTCPPPLLFFIPRQRLIPLARFKSRFKSERNKQSPFFPFHPKMKGEERNIFDKTRKKDSFVDEFPLNWMVSKIPLVKNFLKRFSNSLIKRDPRYIYTHNFFLESPLPAIN